MQTQNVFTIKDADTSLAADIVWPGDEDRETTPRVSIFVPGQVGDGKLITMSLADFRRMVAAVEHQF